MLARLPSSLSDLEGITWAEKLEKPFAVVAMFVYSDPIFRLVFLDGGLSGVVNEPAYNKVMQPLLLIIYGITLYYFYKCREQFKPLVSKGWVVWLMLLIPILSTLWSVYPVITLRRSFALFNTSLFGIYLATRYSLPEILNLLKWTFVVIIAASLTFIVALPDLGKHVRLHVGAFRGVFGHKNIFGILMGVATMTFFAVSTLRDNTLRIFDRSLFGLSLILTFLSVSSTAFLGLLVAMASIPFVYIARWKRHQIIPAVFGTLSIFFFGVVLISQNYVEFLDFFGEDPTFTSRTIFWPYLIDSINQRFWFGYGFEAYWEGGLDGPAAILIQLSSVSAKFSAHNGFLETMLSIGFVGMGFIIATLWLAILKFITKARSTREFVYFYPILFVVFFLLINLPSNHFNTYNSLMWVIFVSMMTLSVKVSLKEPKSDELPIGQISA
ncbi:MAG: O-antigen ligase family protein [Synechococcus sp.]